MAMPATCHWREIYYLQPTERRVTVDICLLLPVGRVPDEGWSMVGATLGVVSSIIASSWCPVPESLAGGDRWTPTASPNISIWVNDITSSNFEHWNLKWPLAVYSPSIKAENYCLDLRDEVGNWQDTTWQKKFGVSCCNHNSGWHLAGGNYGASGGCERMFHPRNMGSGVIIHACSLSLMETFILSVL